MKLETAREVMEAFLAGKKLVNKNYGLGDPIHDMYLYLSEFGWICEEDGAGAKANRVPMVGNYDENQWETIE